jgi:hypothetical protein
MTMIIIVTLTKGYSVYMKYCSEQGENNGNICYKKIKSLQVACDPGSKKQL